MEANGQYPAVDHTMTSCMNTTDMQHASHVQHNSAMNGDIHMDHSHHEIKTDTFTQLPQRCLMLYSHFQWHQYPVSHDEPGLQQTAKWNKTKHFRHLQKTVNSETKSFCCLKSVRSNLTTGHVETNFSLNILKLQLRIAQNHFFLFLEYWIYPVQKIMFMLEL